MRTSLLCTALLLLVAACGESSDPVSPDTASDAPKGKLRIEYYEISKK